MSQNPQDPHQGAPQYGQSAPEGAPQHGGPQYGQNAPEGAPQYGGQQYAQNAPQGAPQYGGQQYEVASGKPQGPAPSAVKKGTLLIYVACALAVIGAILSTLGQKIVDSSAAGGAAGSVAGVFGAVVVAVIGAVFAYLASTGKNWARITSVVFGGVALLRLILVIVSMMGVIALAHDGTMSINAMYYVGAALVIISHLVYIVGNIMYLLKPASAWYRSGKYPQQPVY